MASNDEPSHWLRAIDSDPISIEDGAVVHQQQNLIFLFHTFLVLTTVFLGLQGCAFGPLYSHETAQTLGAGHVELTMGKGNAGYSLNGQVGLSENLDLGIHWESLNLGGRLKYGIISNHERGLSVSGAVGIGISFGGEYYLADASISYLRDFFEPYFTLRTVYVAYSGFSTSYSLNSSSIDYGSFNYNYTYLDPILGSRFWLYEHNLFLSAEVSVPIVFTRVTTSAVYSGAIGCRF